MRRRVMHVITRCIAGAGGVAVRGAVALDPSRYESILVTGTRYGPLLDRARENGVEVVVLPGLRRSKRMAQALSVFRVASWEWARYATRELTDAEQRRYSGAG